MNNLIRSFICIVFLVSCNVVQMVTQEETKVPENFFITNRIEKQINPLTQVYFKTEQYLNEVSRLAPDGSTSATSSTASAPNFNEEFNGVQLFSDNNNSPLTTADWLKYTVKLQDIDWGNGNKYDSPTWKALNTLNFVCAAGMLLGAEMNLGEYEYPQDGSYDTTIDQAAAKALSEYCGVNDDGSLVGMTLTVQVSTPGDTTNYDKKIQLRDNSYYLRYSTNSMTFAGAKTYSNGNNFTRVLINDDLLGNGFALEFIDGPTVGSLTSASTIAMRILHDHINNPTSPFTALMYRYTFDSTPSSETTFFLGGNIGSGTGYTLQMSGSQFTGGASTLYKACLNEASFSNIDDGNDCSVNNGGIVGKAATGMDAQEFQDVHTNWSGSVSSWMSVGPADTTSFVDLSTMTMSSF